MCRFGARFSYKFCVYLVNFWQVDLKFLVLWLIFYWLIWILMSFWRFYSTLYKKSQWEITTTLRNKPKKTSNILAVNLCKWKKNWKKNHKIFTSNIFYGHSSLSNIFCCFSLWHFLNFFLRSLFFNVIVFHSNKNKLWFFFFFFLICWKIWWNNLKIFLLSDKFSKSQTWSSSSDRVKFKSSSRQVHVKSKLCSS